MPLPRTRVLDQSTSQRDEFVAVVAAVLPQTSQAVEAVAMYAMVATLWALIIYFALNILVS